MNQVSGNNFCDAWLAGFYGKMPFESYLLLDRAARTLEGNVARGKKPWSPLRGIRPSCTAFPGIWMGFRIPCHGGLVLESGAGKWQIALK